MGVPEADEIVSVEDAVDDGYYLALYRTNDRLTGAIGLNKTRVIPRLRAMIRRSVSFTEALAWCASL